MLKHLSHKMILAIALVIGLVGCQEQIVRGKIINKWCVEEHIVNDLIWYGDFCVFERRNVPDRYYFTLEDRRENGTIITRNVNIAKWKYQHFKIGDWYDSIKDK